MAAEHPNISLLKRLDLRNLDSCADLFEPEFVWHYFNRVLPEMEGDYRGVGGLKAFFAKLAGDTSGTFRVEPLSVQAYGDELVVAHVRDHMTREGQSISLDALAIWRIVEGRIVEAWDIPAVNTVTSAQDENP